MAVLVLNPASVLSQCMTTMSLNQILHRHQLPQLRMQSFALEQPPLNVLEQRKAELKLHYKQQGGVTCWEIGSGDPRPLLRTDGREQGPLSCSAPSPIPAPSPSMTQATLGTGERPQEGFMWLHETLLSFGSLPAPSTEWVSGPMPIR